MVGAAISVRVSRKEQTDEFVGRGMAIPVLFGEQCKRSELAVEP